MIEGKADELLNLIKGKYETFSKGQKLLATYIINNYEKAAYITAAKLGTIVGVSESTVVRFATQLEFSGYPAFQGALEEMVRNRLNSIQRVEVASERMEKETLLKNVLQADIDKIKLTMSSIDPAVFNDAIDTINDARKVYVIGGRSCAPIAQFLSHYLNLIMENVQVIQTNHTSEILEQLIRVNEEDAVIGISFPRYSLRTMKALEFAKKRNAKIITITDSHQAPVCGYTNYNLIAKSDMISIVDSLVAPLSVVNAIIVALTMKNKERFVHTLETLEEIWHEHQVYNIPKDIHKIQE